jgi:uncharacterized damage-inducible protein DinB
LNRLNKRRDAPPNPTQGDQVIQAWRTHNRTTTYLIEHLPAAIWEHEIPGMPRSTVRSVAAHIHNSRCRWIKSLGRKHGIIAPPLVNLRRVRLPELVRAMSRSSEGIVELIRLGMATGGHVPRATWQNFPTDLEHFLTYFVAHEAHHRGQLMLIARQLGHRLPSDVRNGVWQWTTRSREA